MTGYDTVMYKNKDLNSVTLPVNPAVDSMAYIFYYTNAQATLEIQYSLKTFALAPECNAIDLITLTNATGIAIQNLTVTQSKLSSKTVENIKLYF